VRLQKGRVHGRVAAVAETAYPHLRSCPTLERDLDGKDILNLRGPGKLALTPSRRPNTDFVRGV